MENNIIAPSELVINTDGSAFHLHVKPGQLADKVVLVGDPGRVKMVARHFDRVECEVSNREFHTITGTFRGKRVTCISTGIGCDNIDIVLNEIDSLANIDYATRQIKPQLRQLEIVRVGTCGGLQPDTPVGAFICTMKSVGLDGLLYYYAGRKDVCDTELERAFMEHLGWDGHEDAPRVYAIGADPGLAARIAGGDMVAGITIAANGFYGPQGRTLRLPLAYPTMNGRMQNFEHGGLRVTNFEMESSALMGLCKHMGHRAATACVVVGSRFAKEMNTSYRDSVDELIATVLERI